MCESCQLVSINGIKCHEQGCPDAWMDYPRECLWCGAEFEPEDEGFTCCSDDCWDAYYH
jgi:hypothetical protein